MSHLTSNSEVVERVMKTVIRFRSKPKKCAIFTQYEIALSPIFYMFTWKKINIFNFIAISLNYFRFNNFMKIWWLISLQATYIWIFGKCSISTCTCKKCSTSIYQRLSRLVRYSQRIEHNWIEQSTLKLMNLRTKISFLIWFCS